MKKNISCTLKLIREGFDQTNNVRFIDLADKPLVMYASSQITKFQDRVIMQRSLNSCDFCSSVGMAIPSFVASWTAPSSAYGSMRTGLVPPLVSCTIFGVLHHLWRLAPALSVASLDHGQVGVFQLVSLRMFCVYQVAQYRRTCKYKYKGDNADQHYFVCQLDITSLLTF